MEDTEPDPDDTDDTVTQRQQETDDAENQETYVLIHAGVHPILEDFKVIVSLDGQHKCLRIVVSNHDPSLAEKNIKHSVLTMGLAHFAALFVTEIDYGVPINSSACVIGYLLESIYVDHEADATRLRLKALKTYPVLYTDPDEGSSLLLHEHVLEKEDRGETWWVRFSAQVKFPFNIRVDVHTPPFDVHRCAHSRSFPPDIVHYHVTKCLSDDTMSSVFEVTFCIL
jgi:hypothetical protein